MIFFKKEKLFGQMEEDEASSTFSDSLSTTANKDKPIKPKHLSLPVETKLDLNTLQPSIQIKSSNTKLVSHVTPIVSPFDQLYYQTNSSFPNQFTSSVPQSVTPFDSTPDSSYHNIPDDHSDLITVDESVHEHFHEHRQNVFSEASILKNRSKHSHSSKDKSNTLKQKSKITTEQFTTVSWDQDEFLERHRRNKIYNETGFFSIFKRIFYSMQGWFICVLCGIATAIFSSFIVIGVEWISNLKQGICVDYFWLSRVRCCLDADTLDQCTHWMTWSQLLQLDQLFQFYSDLQIAADFFIFLAFSLLLAFISAFLVKSFSGFAAGSGIPEVKVILGGFTMKKYLGITTLLTKTMALIFAVGCGIKIGLEGPLIHIACALGNVFSRIFAKYRTNEAKKREVLSACCAAAISCAFGAPIGGVIFSMEETSSYFPAKTLYRSFFASTAGSLVFQLINPRDSGRLALFTLSTKLQWHWFELPFFFAIGIVAGIVGTLYNYANILCAKIRRKTCLKNFQITEVLLISIVTCVVCYWMTYTRVEFMELLGDMFSIDCQTNNEINEKLCDVAENYVELIKLFFSGLILLFFTLVSTGLKIPAGMFIPALSIGSAFGCILGLLVKTVQERWEGFAYFYECRSVEGVCVSPALYSILGAAALLSGITKIVVCLVVIIFEVTGQLDILVPVMIVLLVTKWVGDLITTESIYDLIIELNTYPFLNNKVDIKPIGTAADVINSKSQLFVLFADKCTIKDAAETIHNTSQHLYGFPVVTSMKNMGIVGYIKRNLLIKAIHEALQDSRYNLETMITFVREKKLTPLQESTDNRIDFSDYLDSAPLQISYKTSIDRVYDLFKALGLRYVLVTRSNKLIGIMTKKDLFKYVQYLNHEYHKFKRRKKQQQQQQDKEKEEDTTPPSVVHVNGSDITIGTQGTYYTTDITLSEREETKK